MIEVIDQVAVLAHGNLLYSGEASKCQQYFANAGHPWPTGFNVTDFIGSSSRFRPRKKGLEMLKLFLFCVQSI